MARDPGLDLAEHGDARADLARRAVAALVAVMLDKGLLHGVKITWGAEALDRNDLHALVHDREREAGIDPATVDNDRAGTTLAVVAALLGPGQVQVLAQGVEQGGSRVDLKIVGLAVHGQ